MSRNNVRGPTSALTEFLRASGITPTTVARRVATRGPQQHQQPTPGPSGTQADDENQPDHQTAEGEEQEATSSRRQTRSRAAAAANYDSDQLDDPEEEPAPVAKKRKLTKAAEAKLKAKEKAKAKKGKKGGDDDDDDDDEEDDAYKALSKMWSGDAKPPVGSFENCAKCEKQFTVTKYTMAAVPGPGFLCHQCAKASGSDPFKKPAPKRKRAAPADKRSVVHFGEKRFPTLVSVCIQLITQYINDIEAFGDIGTMNMDAISKALSKNRSLTPENAQLFYSVANTTLTFYDATNLTSPALTTLCHLNPALTTLRLDFCGHLDDAAMAVVSSSLPSLCSITLLGPFLVRAPAWLEFIKAHQGLEKFRITQSPRFDLECVTQLVETNRETLMALRLREVGRLGEGFLEQIGTLGEEGKLEELDLADAGQTCSEDSLISLIQDLGESLKILDLSRHSLLSDEFLTSALLTHVKALNSLTLSSVPLITTAGLVSLFSSWENPPLTSISLSRNPELQGEALVALMKHSGKRLEELDVNGWGEVEKSALKAVGKGVELRKVDVGWCREVDDFVVKEWIEGEEETGRGKRAAMPGCRRLQEVKVWGCNKITARCPRKPGVFIHGVESHTAL